MPATGRGEPPFARPLFLLFWSVGILLGLFARELVDGADQAVRSSSVPAAAAANPSRSGVQSAPTVSVSLRAVLELPTATPTGTPTPRPSPTPDLTPIVDFCDPARTDVGEVCRMPMPTPTPEPTMPACFSPEAAEGEYCQHRPTPPPGPWSAATSPDPDLAADRAPSASLSWWPGD